MRENKVEVRIQALWPDKRMHYTDAVAYVAYCPCGCGNISLDIYRKGMESMEDESLTIPLVPRDWRKVLPLLAEACGGDFVRRAS